jgi:hypothetical protein
LQIFGGSRIKTMIDLSRIDQVVAFRLLRLRPLNLLPSST